MSHDFEWRPDEHGEVVRMLVERRFRKYTNRWMRRATWAVVAASVVVAALSLTDGYDGGALLLLVLCAAVLAALYGGPVLVTRIHTARVRRYDPAVQGPIAVDLDATGVRIRTKPGTVHMPWDELHDAEETERHFLFHYGPRTAYYLPKRVVDADGLDRVRAWIEAYRARRPAQDGGAAAAS